MENKFYIYFHVNLSTGKVFYIGRGCNDRAWSKRDRNKYWHNTVNKYGYLVQLFEEGLTLQESKDREIYWIAYFGKENLTNMTDGGEGFSGLKHSEEAKQKMSETRKGRIPPNKGLKMSEEQKIKLREAHKGKKHSEEHKRKVVEARSGYKHSETTKKKMSESAKLYYQNKKLNYGN